MAVQLRDQLKSQTQKYLIEVLIIVLLVWYIKKNFYGSGRRVGRARSDEESEMRILEWHPEPIVPELEEEEKIIQSRIPVVDHPGKGGRELQLDDQKMYLDMASFNFQGLCNLEDINQVAIDKMRTHGVGTCGPRGFYGTMDVHLDLEKKISDIYKTSDTVLFSQSLSTLTSTLYAFIRKGDYVIADSNMNFGIQKGVHTAQCGNTLRLFKHNDMEDLEKHMHEVSEQCKRSRPNARRILVVEAIYKDTGEVCPLKVVVELKKKYDFFLFLDESHSFGVLGETGLGALEYWNLEPTEFDVIMGSLATTFASSGGFATGNSTLIDYLHLNGKSYTFSASTPSLLVAAASYAMSCFFENSKLLSKTLRENSILMHELLQPLSDSMYISKSCESPIIHITPKNVPTSPKGVLKCEKLLSDVVLGCKNDGILFTISRYDRVLEIISKSPSIRISVSSVHSKEDLVNAAKSLIKNINLHFPVSAIPKDA